MRVTGNQQVGQEIIAVLKQWDQAICSLDLHQIIAQCSADVSLFDVSSELVGVVLIGKFGRATKIIFRADFGSFRDRIHIQAESQLAFVLAFRKLM